MFKSLCGHSYNYRGGYILLVMLLLVVVLGALVWLDPSALLNKSDKDLPWNQVRRIVPKGKTVPLPKDGQPTFANSLGLVADCTKDNQQRGSVKIVISTDGRVQGIWSGDFFPQDDIRYEVVTADFEGNIDPSYMYKTDSETDPTRLYIITRGNFMIMETQEKTGQVRKVEGKIYMTGWISPDYYLDGKVIITSDKRNYFEYCFRGELSKNVPLLPAKFNLLKYLPTK